MVLAIIFFELLKEFVEWKIYATSPISKVSKTIVVLSFSVNDLITSLFDQISLILPQMIGFLQLSVIFEKAWSILFDVVIEKALWGHSAIVTLRNFFIIRHLLASRLSGQVLMQVVMAKLESYPLVERCVLYGKFLPETDAGE